VLGKPDSRYEGRRCEIIYVLPPARSEEVSALAMLCGLRGYFGFLSLYKGYCSKYITQNGEGIRWRWVACFLFYLTSDMRSRRIVVPYRTVGLHGNKFEQ
jgi:hypothetical protein